MTNETKSLMRRLGVQLAGRGDKAPRPESASASGALWWGLLGVLGFSLTLPATRVAVPELGGAFVGLARAIVAAFCAGVLLYLRREPLPPRRLWTSLGITHNLGLHHLAQRRLRRLRARFLNIVHHGVE